MVVKVNANIETANELTEEIKTSLRPEYALMDEMLSWSDAEENCKDWGGHLASIQSKEEFDRVVSHSDGNNVWTGGVKDSNGSWSWTNGNPWNFTTDILSSNSRLNCLYLSYQKMKAYMCQKKKRFICQSETITENSSFQKQWNLVAKDFDHPLALEIKFTHKQSNHQKALDQFGGRNQPGFSVEWYLDLEGIEKESSPRDVKASQSSWTQDLQNVPRYLKQNEYLIKMVNVMVYAYIPPVNQKNVMNAIKEGKLLQYPIYSGKKCKNGQLIRSEQRNMFHLDFKSNSTINHWMPLQTIKKGVECFGLATYCKDETLMLWALFENLIQRKTSRALIQASLNTIKNEQLQKRHKGSFTAFFSKLGNLLDLKLPKMLDLMLTESELIHVKEKFAPVFFNSSKGGVQILLCRFCP